ncbi:MAG: anti-sigma factor C-terminal domain-containing protein [Terrisporobacter sp.]
MSFKDIYEKYINNKASEEEIKFIEEEIEKNEIISEHLCNKIDDDLFNTNTSIDNVLDKNDEKNDNDFKKKKNEEDILLKKINRKIRNKFLKTCLASVVVVIGILAGVKYIVSPMIDSKYYNPTTSRGEFSTQFLRDISVFTELHFPGIITSYTNEESLGYGKYNVSINQNNTFKNNGTTYEGVINEGKLEYISHDFYKYPVMNIFKYGVYPFTDAFDDDSEQLKELKQLPSTSQVSAYVSFNKDIDMKEISKMIKSNEDLYFSWVGVRTCDKNTQLLPQMGFESSGSGIILEGFKNNKDYPYLEFGGIGGEYSGNIYETHFKSLVKYMRDNKDFIDLQHPNAFTSKYEDTLDYVEKNGVKSYGVLVNGSADDILKLRENKFVFGLSVDDVKVSVYSH